MSKTIQVEYSVTFPVLKLQVAGAQNVADSEITGEIWCFGF